MDDATLLTVISSVATLLMSIPVAWLASHTYPKVQLKLASRVQRKRQHRLHELLSYIDHVARVRESDLERTLFLVRSMGTVGGVVTFFIIFNRNWANPTTWAGPWPLTVIIVASNALSLYVFIRFFNAYVQQTKTLLYATGRWPLAPLLRDTRTTAEGLTDQDDKTKALAQLDQLETRLGLKPTAEPERLEAPKDGSAEPLAVKAPEDEAA